jgi:hypothetical protein
MSEYERDTGEEKSPEQGEGAASEGSEAESDSDKQDDAEDRAQEGA